MTNTTNTKFLSDFVFDVSQNPSSLKQLSKSYLSKSVNSLLNKLQSAGVILRDTQIIGIILKVKFTDGSMKSISTYRKGMFKNKLVFINLFKHLLNLKS